nr:hypothetical protein [Tanacetum cinerariifolium]
VVAGAKLYILNPNEFNLWKMRIQQYFLTTDYSLWEVILNANSPTPTRVVDGVVQSVAPNTAEQRLAKKNELKARGTLLMSLPDKHQLKFNIHKDANMMVLVAMIGAFRYNALVELRKKFEKAEKERDELKLTLAKFQTSLKNLSKLLASQITDKTGLGLDNQVFNSTVFDCDELISSELVVSMPTSLVHDRPSAPLIEDWVSDSEYESKGEPMPTQITPSFVQTSEHVKPPRLSVNPVKHPTPTKNLRKDIPKSRGHRHSWNRKAYFVCKSLAYLIKDYDYYKEKMV